VGTERVKIEGKVCWRGPDPGKSRREAPIAFRDEKNLNRKKELLKSAKGGFI